MIIKSINTQSNTIFNTKEHIPPFDFSTLLETTLLQPYHAKAIQLKVYLSVGLGYEIWTADGLDENAKNRFEELFPDGFTNVIYNIALDFETFGNAYLEIVNKNPKHGFKASAIYHVPAITIKITNDGFVQEIGDDKRHFEAYDESKERGIYHIKMYNPGAGIYGIPDWISCINSIMLDIYATNWNYKFFENNCIPQWAIIIKGGELTKQMEEEIQAFFTQRYKGIGNSHKTLLMSAENIDVRFERLQDIKDMDFIKLKEVVRDEIVAAHGVPPRLLGVVTPGQLGAVGENKWQLKQFKNGILKQRQEFYRGIFKKFLPEGWDIYFNEMDVTDLKEDADFYKQMVEAGILTPNEARNEIGYEIREDLDSLSVARILGRIK